VDWVGGEVAGNRKKMEEEKEKKEISLRKNKNRKRTKTDAAPEKMLGWEERV
jgi:hypothetical protein